MATNPYFNNFNYAGEQNLIEDLVLESIKIYGIDVYYLPRTLVDTDQLFGEDVLSKFESAIPVEMYIKNVEGFEGEGDFLSRFNLEVRDEITFSLARRRWDQIRTEKIITEESWNLLQEDGDGLKIEDASGNNYVITSVRPLEGDVLYEPLTTKLYEIKFVEREPVFYQTGALQFYDLRCELFEYSNEEIDTGYSEVDEVEDLNSTNVLFYELLLEDGNKLLNEDGDSLLTEYDVADVQPTSDNNFIERQQLDILDFSESNPFSEDW